VRPIQNTQTQIVARKYNFWQKAATEIKQFQSYSPDRNRTIGLHPLVKSKFGSGIKKSNGRNMNEVLQKARRFFTFLFEITARRFHSRGLPGTQVPAHSNVSIYETIVINHKLHYSLDICYFQNRMFD